MNFLEEINLPLRLFSVPPKLGHYKVMSQTIDIVLIELLCFHKYREHSLLIIVLLSLRKLGCKRRIYIFLSKLDFSRSYTKTTVKPGHQYFFFFFFLLLLEVETILILVFDTLTRLSNISLTLL